MLSGLKGHYVTAKLLGQGDCRQGMFLCGDSDHFVIIGELDQLYICCGSPSLVDEVSMLSHSRIWLEKQRVKYGLRVVRT